jgi:hypothetical protein
MHPEAVHKAVGRVPDIGRKETGETYVTAGAPNKERYVFVFLVPEATQIIFFWC